MPALRLSVSCAEKQKAASPLARADGRPRLANVESLHHGFLLRYGQKSATHELRIEVIAHDGAVIVDALRATVRGIGRAHRYERGKMLRALRHSGAPAQCLEQLRG